MGRVYRARLQGPGLATKPVALKTLNSHLTQSQPFVQMFLEEARIAMALQHRNIVQTFDGGLAEGHYYLVMELVRGCSVHHLLKQIAQHKQHNALPVSIALFIATEVCSALDYAHTFVPEDAGHPGGVLHRDVSPSNILLSELGDVKLTDFGVAKAAGRLYRDEDNLVRGKLPYMAPEQARGEEELRSDLFSLGAVLYEMLSSRRIRDDVTVEQVEIGVEIAPLSDLRPEIPSSLAEAVHECLEMDPGGRPRSARELKDTLSSVAEELRAGQSDPHTTLQTFLGQVGTPKANHEDQAALVAACMVQEARAVPTDPAAREHAFTLSSLANREELTAVVNEFWRVTSTDEGTRHQRLQTRRVLAAAAALLLMAAFLVAIMVVYYPTEETPVAPGDAGARSLAPAVDAHPPLDVPAPIRHRPKPDDLITRPAPRVSRPARSRSRRATPPRKRHPAGRRSAQPTPKARGEGRLSINAVPWARVHVDGVYRGNTPVQNLPLEAGEHLVRLVNPERGLSRTLRVKIRPQRTLSRVIFLRRTDR